MGYQTIFKRYEFKYLISREQKERILDGIDAYMALDRYGRTTIRNIYFDTENFRLIRRSIDKPVYKEKLRIRSYRQASPDSTVFVELKKKYKNIVYKRRLSLCEGEALEWLLGEHPCKCDTQISREIDYFMKFYESLRPKVFLTYEREAYYMRDGGDFRVTFDDNILCRTDNISLEGAIYGTRILNEEEILMEIKCAGGIPLFMTEILSREKIYKTPYSKYGIAYTSLIYPKLKETNNHELIFQGTL